MHNDTITEGRQEDNQYNHANEAVKVEAWKMRFTLRYAFTDRYARLSLLLMFFILYAIVTLFKLLIY